MLGTHRRCRTSCVRVRCGQAGRAARTFSGYGLWSSRRLTITYFHLLCVGLLALSLGGIAQAAAPQAWVAPSLIRVRPDDATGTTTSISLAAAKGETESFQIIVKAPTANGLTNVNVTSPSLGGTQPTLYREHYIYLASGSGDWATNINKPLGPGWYPDALVPLKNPSTGAPLNSGSIVGAPFTVNAGKNQPVWVDIYVPRSAAAGAYTGAFTVTSDQGTASVTVTFKVWNFTLPVKPALESCFMYWPTSSSGEGRGVYQADAELLKNRLNPINTNTSYERSFIDTLGMQSVSLSFWSNADQSTGYIAPAPSVSSILSQKAAHQQDLHFYCYSADEVTNPALFSGIKAWGRAFHSAGVDQLITMPPFPELQDDGSGTGRSAVDIWVMLPKQYDQYKSDVLTVQNKGDQVWSYNCTQQDDYSPKWLLDYAPINYRIQTGFINQSLGLLGLLYWRVDWWTTNVWAGAFPWSYLPGEGVLMYPGANVGLSGQVVPSMRLKYLRDGVDDYDYVELLKQQGQGTWALSVARSVGPDWTNWTRDPNAVEAARLQLGNKLDSLAGGSHTISVTAIASPTTVASGGTATLSGSASDSLGHAITSWRWSDDGAGGAFSSATAQNPTYTAPVNTGSTTKTVVLTLIASDGTISGTGTASLSVASPTTHTLSLNTYASPSTVVSGGTTILTAAVSDSLGHSIATWRWSDGGAGGKFSSTTVQNPTYTAPANTSGSNRTVTLTVTATCSGTTPLTKSASTSLTVQSTTTGGHGVNVTISASATTMASGATITLRAMGADTQGHTGLAWQWSDNGAGGTFSAPTSASTSYTAPANTSSSARTITMTASGICKWQYPWITGTLNLAVTEDTSSPPAHAVAVTASASPTSVASGGSTNLTATATDTQRHTSFLWSWSDNGAGGTFSSTSVPNPTYKAPGNTTGATVSRTLTVTVTCNATSTPVSSKVNVTISEASTTPTSTHTITTTASASPTTVASGGTTTVYATAVDNQGHTGFAWSWSDGGAGGTFSPSASVQNPTYKAPGNTSGKVIARKLTVTATCRWFSTWVSGSATVTVTENSGTPSGHAVNVTASVSATTISSTGSVTLKATGVDTLGHTGLAYQWTDNGAGGTFSSTTVANPTYKPPVNTTGVAIQRRVTVSVICKWQYPWITGKTDVIITQNP